jgi:hypothetical protein
LGFVLKIIFNVFKSVSTSFNRIKITSFELLHTTPAIKDLAFYSTTYPLFHQEKNKEFFLTFLNPLVGFQKIFYRIEVTFKSRNGCDFIFNFTFLSQDKKEEKLQKQIFFIYIFKFVSSECKVTKFQQIAFANIHS